MKHMEFAQQTDQFHDQKQAFKQPLWKLNQRRMDSGFSENGDPRQWGKCGPIFFQSIGRGVHSFFSQKATSLKQLKSNYCFRVIPTSGHTIRHVF